jgi:hypothetical protein
MHLLRLTSLIIVLLASQISLAGVIELGAQANYRGTNFDPSHADVSESGTGSIGYYFWDVSAIEFSYTRGASEQTQPEYTAYQDLTAYGMDLMITLANKESSLKPYIKLGAAYVDKNLREFFPGGLLPISIETHGVAPSAGLGFKLMLTERFALKAGFDASSSPLFFYSSTSADPNTVTYDFSAYGGLSILF